MAGNANSGRKTDKLWGDALRLAVMREVVNGDKRTFLAEIAERTVAAAVGGDMAAIREIGDRLDGKPAQAIENSGSLTVYLAKPDESFT
jgi:hypothetical protein